MVAEREQLMLAIPVVEMLRTATADAAVVVRWFPMLATLGAVAAKEVAAVVVAPRYRTDLHAVDVAVVAEVVVKLLPTLASLAVHRQLVRLWLDPSVA